MAGQGSKNRGIVGAMWEHIWNVVPVLKVRNVLTWMIFDVLAKVKCFIFHDSVMNQLCL